MYLNINISYCIYTRMFLFLLYYCFIHTYTIYKLCTCIGTVRTDYLLVCCYKVENYNLNVKHGL